MKSITDISKKIEGFINSHILHLFVVATCSLLLGSMLTLKYTDIAKKCEILVIAREELLQLEKEWIKVESDKDMFFGMIGPDLQKIIEEVVMGYKSRKIKVIYSSYGGIMGDNVQSISREVHREVIRILQLRSLTTGSFNKETKTNKGK